MTEKEMQFNGNDVWLLVFILTAIGLVVSQLGSF